MLAYSPQSDWILHPVRSGTVAILFIPVTPDVRELLNNFWVYLLNKCIHLFKRLFLGYAGLSTWFSISGTVNQ